MSAPTKPTLKPLFRSRFVAMPLIVSRAEHHVITRLEDLCARMHLGAFRSNMFLLALARWRGIVSGIMR